jgi:hypothetical protein
MFKYDITVLIRGRNDKNNGLMDQQVKTTIIAPSRLEARKLVLERAWSTAHVVSKFISIKQRSTT